MSKNEKLICVISCLWFLASTMSSAFVSVYLYSYTGSLVVMSLYTFVRIGMFPIFFTFGAKLAQKRGFATTLFLGLIISISYLVVILFGNHLFEQNIWVIYLVGVLIGIGESFYWMSSHSLSQLVSTPDSRMIFLSNMGIGNNLAKLVAPGLAAIFISLAATDMEGYIDIFKVILAVYIIIAIVITKVNVQASPRPFKVWRHLFKDVKENREWRFCALSSILFGIRDSLVLTLTGLLVYNATGGQGNLYSQLLIVFSFITIAAYYFIGKKITRKKRISYFAISSILISSSTLVLVFFPTLEGAIYFGVVNAVATPVYLNIYQSDYMAEIHRYSEKENIIGRVIARETHLVMGRLNGMLFVVLCWMIFPESQYILISVTLCSLAPIVLLIYMILHERYMQRR